ncbi:MAG: DUF3108 domain-containing protein [Alcaligenaceae bacterium]|nr:DUF3108 domain-containing protein [Alcaligenaceae bacterium]
MNFLKKTNKIWTQALLIFTLALSSTASAQSEIDYVDAIFAVSYNNTSSSSNAYLKIQNNSGEYDARFSLEHTLLDTSQGAKFNLQSCHITPQSYSSTTSPALRSTTRESLNFNWTNKTAARHHSKDGDMSFNLQQHLYDPMSLFFKARCDLIAGKKNLSYPLIYKGKESKHQYNVIGTETVKTGMGEFEALVVQRQRNNPDRRTTFFVAPALDYLIVKITHRENSMTNISMTLKSMSYKTK